MKVRRLSDRVWLGAACALLLTACGESPEDRQTDGGARPQPNADAGADVAPDDEADGGTTLGDGSSSSDGETMQVESFADDCTMTLGPKSTPKKTTDALTRAFVRISSGETLCLVDGTYMVRSQLNLNTSGVEIRGESESGTVLDFSEQKDGANGILVQVEKNFAARNLTIRDTASDALKTKNVDGVVFDNVTVTWSRETSEENGAYGLYPVESENVLIEDCTVSGARDAGVYLGQSENAIIRGTEAFGNVVGIEIENTIHAEVYDNYAHDNTAGFLIIALPDLKVKENTRTLVYDNRAIENNVENFAKGGTTVSRMPQGTGILVMTTDGAEVRNNEVEGNQSVGIGLGSHLLFDQQCCDDEQYDPYSEDNWIHGNTLLDNGNDPKGLAKSASMGAAGDEAPQLFWDGQYDDAKDNDDEALTNCFGGNVDGEGNALEMTRLPLSSKCPDDSEGNPPSFCRNDCQKDAVAEVELPDRVTREVE